VALQTGQEWSPPCAKEDLPTLCEFGDGQEVSIGGRLISFGHGYNVEDEKRRGIGQRREFEQRMSTIGQRMSATQRACMSEIEIGTNPPIFNALKVETVEFVGEFITHDFPCVTMTARF
jgi:hypothetical protein